MRALRKLYDGFDWALRGLCKSFLRLVRALLGPSEGLFRVLQKLFVGL